MEEKITVDFVKKWIEKHHLTKKSYETVLSDTLTNNGHYYIDNPYLRDWIKENKTVFRDLLPYDLNENQQIVLEQLQINAGTEGSLIKSVHSLHDLQITYSQAKNIVWTERWLAATRALIQLNRYEELQVLAAFAEWGMKNEQ